MTGRILVAWTMTDRADRLWEVTRHENGRPILVGSYVSREFAWGTMDADRAFHLEDPRYFELQSPGGQKRIKRSDMDGLAPTWMKILAIALICVAVGLFVCLLWRSFENDKRCAAAIGPGSTFYANDLCSPPPVHVDGLFLG